MAQDMSTPFTPQELKTYEKVKATASEATA